MQVGRLLGSSQVDVQVGRQVGRSQVDVQVGRQVVGICVGRQVLGRCVGRQEGRRQICMQVDCQIGSAVSFEKSFRSNTFAEEEYLLCQVLTLNRKRLATGLKQMLPTQCPHEASCREIGNQVSCVTILGMYRRTVELADLRNNQSILNTRV